MDVAGWQVGLEDGSSDHPYSRSCDPSEFVPLVFAHSLPQAKRYRRILEQYGIPTLVESDPREFNCGLLMRRVPLLVPEEMQDDASEIVAWLERRSACAPRCDDGDGDDEYYDDDDEDPLDDDDDFDDDGDDDLLDDDDEF